MEKDLGNPKQTIEIIQKYQFAFQKKFGQNFLIDTHVLDKIISAAGITGEDCVLEIGPGIGTMTQHLAEHAGRVVAVEIDTNLLPILDETLKGYDNVTVINSDILKLDMNDYMGQKFPEEFQMAAQICEKLGKDMRCQFSKVEIGYLAMHLQRILTDEELNE